MFAGRVTGGGQVGRGKQPQQGNAGADQCERGEQQPASRNWRGRPLESHEVIIETLKAVTTTTGLTVHTELDTNSYERGINIPDKDMKTLEETGILTRHDFHGDWNYSLNPRDTPKQPT